MKDQLTGRLKELFGIPNKLIPKLHYNLHELHKQILAREGKLQVSDELHRIALRLFYSDYFPIISRNIKIDDNNTTIIMGGIAYNMNIPDKMKFLLLDTDDIDIKIYTTGINYLEQGKYAVAKVLSVFKFTILILCMYLKQLFNLIIKFTPNIPNSDTKSILTNYELILQIKLKEKDSKTFRLINTIDITKLTYSQLYDKIIDNVNDYNLLITNKIVYKPTNTNKLRTITFGDSTVVYAGLGSSAFFAQYLESTPQSMNKPLEKLVRMKIPVSKIIDIKTCANNCRFMSINSLIMDNVIMLSYSDLLAYEQLEDNSGQILVPAGFIFKYYKYLVKYIRLILLRKFYANTLDKSFVDEAKALWQYAQYDIRKKAGNVRLGLDERDPIVITYKNYLNEFHQNLFHNKTFLLTNYPSLIEIADEYQRLVFFVNKSRNLFRTLNESTKTNATSIDNIIIKFAEQELSKYSNSSHLSKSSSLSKTQSKPQTKSISGGSIYNTFNKKTSKTRKTSKTLILSANNDNIDEGNEVGNEEINNVDIISKIDKLLKEEVKMYSSIPKSISKRSQHSRTATNYSKKTKKNKS